MAKNAVRALANRITAKDRLPGPPTSARKPRGKASPPANRHADCWTHARRAAARACDKHANVEAVELFERALSTIRHLEHPDERDVAAAWRELAIRRIFLGDGDGAKDALRQARRWAPDCIDGFDK